jgi:hypothetical protein
MIPPEGFGAGESVIPLDLLSPWHFQVVTEKEPQRIDFLPEHPLIDLRISPQTTQPGLNRGD